MAAFMAASYILPTRPESLRWAILIYTPTPLLPIVRKMIAIIPINYISAITKNTAKGIMNKQFISWLWIAEFLILLTAIVTSNGQLFIIAVCLAIFLGYLVINR
jgi:hypothetical protein